MSSVLSSLASYLRGALSSILRAFRGVIKQAWPLVVIALIVYYSPALLNWASANGAPVWLTAILEKAFSVNVALSGWLATTWAAFLVWFSELSFAYQVLLAFGIGYILNPEGAVELAGSIADALTDLTKGLLEPPLRKVGFPLWLLGVGAVLILRGSAPR